MEEPRHVSYARVADKLQRREVIILDGGTGTDIQRRGAPMSGDTWCADANLTHPDIVRAVHVIPPAEMVRKSHGWQHLGASVFGGCCGIGPDHIAALTRAFRSPRSR